MKISYSKVVLSLLLASSFSVSAFAAEKISTANDNVVDSNHAYETVIHIDDKKEGYELAEGWKVTEVS